VTFPSGRDRAFEDFAVGDTVITDGRTIEMSDILQFAGLTGDHYPLHVDEEYASNTQFGGRIAHGPLTFAIAVGLMGLSGFYGTAIEALIECRSLRAKRPVRPGDTIRVHAEVAEVGDAKKPEHGTLHVEYSVRNQNGDEVMCFRWIMVARRRQPQEASR
jgi:3-hydroxybutyryl-CoA dehydratase